MSYYRQETLPVSKKKSNLRGKRTRYRLPITNLQIMHSSQEIYHTQNTESNETERGETEKLSTTQKKRNQVRHSWKLRGLREQTILRREDKGTTVLLQDLTKSLIVGTRSVKEKWANRQQLAKMCQRVSTWQQPHRHWVHSAGKKRCLNSPIGA